MEQATEIQWSLGHTMNMGDFQSLRIDCSVKDFKRGAETIQEASNRIYGMVERELLEKVSEARKALQ